MCRLWVLALCCLSVVSTVSAVDAIVGALLMPTDPEQLLKEQALRNAQYAVNHNSNRSTTVNITVERLGDGEQSFTTSRRVCQLFEKGVVAILGPSSDLLSDHVRSMCDHKSVPLLETRWSPASRRPQASINLHPHTGTLSKAVADILRLSGWRNVSVVYEDNQSLISVQDALKLTMGNDSIRITVKQLPPYGDYRHMLRKLRDEGAVNFLVACSRDNVLKFLKHAQMVGMIIQKYSYFITSLDLHTLPLEDFLYSGSNITGLRLVRPTAAVAPGSLYLPPSAELTTEAALTWDAVELLARALDSLYGSGGPGSFNVSREPLDCGTQSAWKHGETLINYLLQVQFDGLTGHVSFDSGGLRRSFQLDIIQLQEPALVKIGSWSPSGIETMNFDLAEIINRKNQTIIVTTVMKPPYTMLKPSSDQKHGNDRYTGICVELMDRLAEIHNFNYTLIVNPEGTAGKPDSEGRWNGMIGDLLSGKAHLAIADLTITATRGKAINFTTQWMSLGISMVYTKPSKQPPSLFSFLAPFSKEVWAYMGMAMVGVSLLMFVLARFSPYEWQNPHPCDDEPEELENILTTRNSFWFAIGSLMQQGSDIAPKAMSTRMIAGIWWGFTLIMISSYTANLAAFLTIETRYSPIESVGDLVKPRNKHIKYGLYEKGSTADFFKRSKVEPYMEMWEVMNSTEEFRASDEDGINSVIKANGKFAYFMESSSIEYYVARRCQLTQVGGLLDNKGYGIGVGPQSPIQASDLSVTIIQLQEEGYLSKLKHKWWKGETGGVNCDAKESTATAPLSLKNVGGVFVCLVLGLCVATMVSIAEFVLEAYKTSREERVPLLTEISRELQFVFQFRGNTKPVKRPVTSSADTEQEGFIPFSTESSLQYAPTGYGFSAVMT
ncbi:glutamate receptor ionotropic, kainate 2-like isoform X1 [Amphibalanus amphitrite]|uniref:glutamate receptor ionotropic, kainate 2-like isoform X1 n=1 Tax=Amphibalanus amphitrite TaxID=1232801 RepID=UPI001C905459|nr:glutamate receptor ionotropic, kainate 2-like isoform X1 [Amphibalanus amphitrite]